MRKLKLQELGRINNQEFKESKKTSIILVLDNIRSAMNVGSFFRTSDGFAIEKIFLCGISATPPHKEISKTAIGAEESIEWEYKKDIEECVSELKKEGNIIVGIEQTDSSVMLNEFNPDIDSKYCLIFGNEVDGISENILQYLDLAIEIPQFGTKHSFNVSVAGGIVLWDFVNKLKFND